MSVPGKKHNYRGLFTVMAAVGPQALELSDGSVWNASKLVIIHSERELPSRFHSSLPRQNQSQYSASFPRMVFIPITGASQSFPRENGIQAPVSSLAVVPSHHEVLPCPEHASESSNSSQAPYQCMTDVLSLRASILPNTNEHASEPSGS